MAADTSRCTPPRRLRGAWVFSLVVGPSIAACSGTGADGAPDFAEGVPSYDSSGGAGSTGVNPGAGMGSSGSGSEQSQNGGLPVVGGNAGSSSNGGSGMVANMAGASGAASMAGASGDVGQGGQANGGAGGTGQGPGTLPTPPEGAFFFDDFEAGAVGEQPAAWDRWIDYSVNAGNSLAGAQYALIDDQERFSGNQSVHFHVSSGNMPAMLTRALPAGTTSVYVRAYVKTTDQIGDQAPDAESNHETLMGLRATPNDGNFEIRFGGAKGALGFNMVGPGRNDAVAPPQALWGTPPGIQPGDWHCVELAFLNDDPANPQAHASVDGQNVRSVTSLSDWHVMPGTEGVQWLNGMFTEVILGWQSFSPEPANDIWMDDVVLSSSPIGCD